MMHFLARSEVAALAAPGNPEFLRKEITHAITEGWEYCWEFKRTPQVVDSAPWKCMSPEGWKSLPVIIYPDGRNGRSELLMRVKLPKNSWSEPTMFLTGADQLFELYLDKEKHYSYGELDDPAKRKFNGYPWHMILLPENFGEKMAYFRIYSEHSNLGLFGAVLIGKQSTHILRLVRNELGRASMGLASVVFGLACLLFCLRKSEQRLAYMSYATLILSSGTYALTRTTIKQLFYYSPHVWLYIEFISLSLILASFNGFFWNAFKARVCLYGLRVTLLYSCITIPAAALGFIPLMKTLPFIQLLVVVSVLYITIYSFIKSRSGILEAKLIVFGFGGGTAIALYEIAMALGLIPSTGSISHLLLAPMNVSLGAILLLRFMDVVKKLGQYSIELEQKSTALEEKNQALHQLSGDLERKNEDLSRLDKLKDEFLANTSHELKTPLNGIIGIAESMLVDLGPQANPMQRRNLSILISSGRRLCNLVNDILDFSKLRHRSLDLRLTALSLADSAENVLMLMRSTTAKKDVTIINEVNPELPPVLADENRLQQILHNLMGNAIKFTERGTIKVTAEQRGNTIEISVTDTGVGIPQEAFARIFESFEQADGSVSRNYGGTGLGLAITKQLIELHGGSIGLESEVDRGSRFYFTLKVASEMQTSSSAFSADDESSRFDVNSLEVITENILSQAINSTENQHSENDDDEVSSAEILIVDDEPVNLYVLRRHLEVAGYQVQEAHSGSEALEILGTKEKQFDLVLLDVMMPRMSGFEVCRRIRSSYAPHELPVILLTARSQSKDIVEGFKCGANDYMTKPVTREELLARTHVHVELERMTKRIELLLCDTNDIASATTDVDAIVRTIGHILRISEKHRHGKCIVTIFNETSHQVEKEISLDYEWRKDKVLSNDPALIDEPSSWYQNLKCDLNKTELLTPFSLETHVMNGTLYIPIQREAKIFGLVEMRNFTNQLNLEITEKESIAALAQTLSIVLERFHAFKALIDSEMRMTAARFEELGKVAVKLGDKLNNPLNIMLLVSEEMNESLLQFPSNNAVTEELQRNVKLIERSIGVMREELTHYHRFKAYAPSNALSSDFGDTGIEQENALETTKKISNF